MIREFAIFFDYACGLHYNIYNETPDYKHPRSLFDLLRHEGHKHDSAFDWYAIDTSRNNIVANCGQHQRWSNMSSALSI
jgi:hypothetical protein